MFSSCRLSCNTDSHGSIHRTHELNVRKARCTPQQAAGGAR